MLDFSDFFSPLDKTGVQISVRHRLNARLLFLNMETKTRQIEHPVIYLFIFLSLRTCGCLSLTDRTLLAVCADIKEQLSIAGSGNTLPSSTSWHQRMLPLSSFFRTRTCSRLKLSYEWNWIDFYLLDVRGWKPYFSTRVIGFVTSFLAWEGGRPHLECRALAGNFKDVRASEVALVGERGWCCGLGFVWVVVVLTLQNSDKASPLPLNCRMSLGDVCLDDRSTVQLCRCLLHLDLECRSCSMLCHRCEPRLHYRSGCVVLASCCARCFIPTTCHAIPVWCPGSAARLLEATPLSLSPAVWRGRAWKYLSRGNLTKCATAVAVLQKKKNQPNKNINAGAVDPDIQLSL